MNSLFIVVKKNLAKVVINISYFLNEKSKSNYFYSKCNYVLKLILKLIPAVPFEVCNHHAYVSLNSNSSIEILKLARATFTSHITQNLEPLSPLLENKAPHLFCAKHENVKIHGNSDFVICNNALAINEFGFNMNPSYSNIDGLLWRQKKNFVLFKYNGKDTNLHLDKGIMLSGRFSENYYHVLFEILMKVLIINEFKIPNDVPLIMDDSILKVKSFNEIFKILNTSNRSIIYIKKNEIFSISCLYYISNVNLIPPHILNYSNINVNDFYFDSSLILKMRENLIHNKSSTKFPERIFLSRKSSKNRKYNEDEIVAITRKFGFEVVSPEKFSFSDQMSMFNGAKYIVGATGAAFSNILFCQEDCKIICLQSRGMDLPIFSTIAGIVKAEMRYIIGKPHGFINRKSIHARFKINVYELDYILENIFKK